jgi:3-hydroxybutyryl-CoA dehydrogenase
MTDAHALVVGGGTMGTGIAYVLALSGRTTTLVEPDPGRTVQAATTLAEVVAGSVAKGRFDRDTGDALLARIVTVGSVAEAPEEPSVAIEAVPERADLKHRVLAQMEALRPGLLASNTSGLSVSELASGLKAPGSFLGLHFFNPVWSMPLVEIVKGGATTEETVGQARDLVAALGKESIVVRDTPGFATSRLGVAIGLEAMRMLQEGVAEAADIDKAMELGYRHPMGPLRLSDLVGLDVRLDIARHLAGSLGPRFDPPAILVEMVAQGRLGKKTGRGFYEW